MPPSATKSNQAEIYAKRRKQLFIVGVIAFIILIVIVIFLFIVDSQKTASVDILVAPSFAKVEINGKKYKSKTTTRVKPGEATAVISADGFESQEINLTFEKDVETKVYVILNPTTGNADFYKNNPTEANLAQRISEALVRINADLYLKEHPIINVLPIIVTDYNQETNTWLEYRIDYGEFQECATDFCLKITDTTGGNYNRAIEKIREKGFNPDDYEFIYQSTPVEPMSQPSLEQIYQHYGVN